MAQSAPNEARSGARRQLWALAGFARRRLQLINAHQQCLKPMNAVLGRPRVRWAHVAASSLRHERRPSQACSQCVMPHLGAVACC
eukprot:7579212-Alexandrium_andersonii.AAC.1